MSPFNRDAETDQYRAQLYDAMADEELSLVEKMDRGLEIGQSVLDVENGHVERITDDGDSHEIVASVGEESVAPIGQTVEQSKTFCRHTLTRRSALAFSDASADGWDDDPAYDEWGLECYLGTPIYVEGESYGTVCFVSEDSRAEAFDSGERAFVELLARLLGRQLEARTHEQRLEASKRQLDARERALDRSEQKYESLLRAAPDAILLIDTDTGTIVEANEAAVELTGYDRGALQGMAHLDLHASDQRERYRAAFESFVRESRTRARFDDGTPLTIRRQDGSEVPVEISATTVTLDGTEYVQGIVRDISERRDREAELRVKNRAIDAASIGITIADATDPDLPLVYANEAFSRLTGYDADEVLRRNCRLLQGPDTDPETVAEIGAALDRAEPITTEVLNYRSDGTPFWNELSLAPVEDADGEVTHFVGFQRDVSQRERHQRLTAVLNRVLRHNLRNKANVVMGQAGHLAERLDGHEEPIDRIEAAATDLAELSEKSHDLESSVGERGNPRARDVVPLVTDAVGTCRASHPSVDVDVSAPSTLTAFVPQQLSTALSELLDNAAEHAGESPTVSVDVDTDDDGVTIRIADDGPGLPENERTVLRRGYETPLEHSNGLGLALVSWIVTGVGGRVTASVDDGTTVTIRLPRPANDGPEAGRWQTAPSGMGTDD